MTPTLPEYTQLEESLQQLQDGMHAAELHGQLCGLLVVDDRLTLTEWLHESLPGLDSDTIPSIVHSQLQDLLEYSRAGLRDEDFGFQLLLPDDDNALAERVEALGYWCQGFLLGVNTSGLRNSGDLPGDLPEILDDFLGISQAERYELVNEEEDEAAYVELVEYVRISAQLFCEELRGGLSGQPKTIPPSGGQLH
jgi:uncharacterized protein YgfB (UPF0149 family)